MRAFVLSTQHNHLSVSAASLRAPETVPDTVPCGNRIMIIIHGNFYITLCIVGIVI